MKARFLAWFLLGLMGFSAFSYAQIKANVPPQVRQCATGKIYWFAEVQDILFSRYPQEGERLSVGVRVKFTKKTIVPITSSQSRHNCAFEGPSDTLTKNWSKIMSIRLTGIKYSGTETNLLEYSGPTFAFPPYKEDGFPVIGFVVTENDLKKGYIDIWGWTSKEPLRCEEGIIYASLAIYNQFSYNRQNECHPHPDFKKGVRPRCLEVSKVPEKTIKKGTKILDINSEETPKEKKEESYSKESTEEKKEEVYDEESQREESEQIFTKESPEEKKEEKKSLYPDLLIEKAGMIYDDQNGYRASLVVQIKNAGSKDSCSIDYLIEIKNNYHDWESIQSGQWKYLKPDEKVEQRLSLYKIDYIGSTFSFGENLIRITLDYQNKENEYNKENNIFVFSFIPRAPDLKIISMNLETKDRLDGTSDAVLHFTIKNEGDAYPMAKYISNIDDRRQREENFLNLTITKKDGRENKIQFIRAGFSQFSGLKNYLLAPGESKEFCFNMPEMMDVNSRKESPGRLSNNCLYGEIDINLTLDEKQLLYDVDYGNNSYTYSLNNQPVFKIHPESPTAYLNIEKEMYFYVISNLDFNEHHSGVFCGTWFMPELKFYWGDYELKVIKSSLLINLEDRYKVPDCPIWEIRAEMPLKEGEAGLRADIGNDSFYLGKIKLYGLPVITESPSELMERGKRYSFKGKNFISPEHFGKMFQNYQVEIVFYSSVDWRWPYYYVSEEEFQTEAGPFDCSGYGYLIVKKVKKGYGQVDDVISKSPFGAGIKPAIEFSPASARKGEIIDISIFNYCETIEEIRLNDISLEIISHEHLRSNSCFKVKARIPENATSGRINFRYGNFLIESEKILEILDQ